MDAFSLVTGSEFQVPGFRFPYGSNEYCSAWAFTWGKLRFAFSDTNGSWLVTWEDFALNRDTSTPVNAQIEFRADGDFVTLSNEVETVCRRIDPNDFDGDGWHNDDDANPCERDDPWDDFCQELPENANTNAYCWIDVRPEYNTWVSFCGDGPSDLADPSFTAWAGETRRVQLLIGKTYQVSGGYPLSVVGKSSPDILVGGNGTRSLTVQWPVTMTVSEIDDGAFRVNVRPASLGGVFDWTSYCCSLTGLGTEYAFSNYVPEHGGFSAVRSDTWKCNIFVAHRLVDCGLSVPAVRHGRFGIRNWPPLAREWGNPSFAIQGWCVLETGEYPQPGMLAIRPAQGENWHMGILDFDEMLISAQRDAVTRFSDVSKWPSAVYRKRGE